MRVVGAAVGVISHVARSKKRWKSVVGMRETTPEYLLAVQFTPQTPPYPPTSYETHAWSTPGPPDQYQQHQQHTYTGIGSK